jgi:hypothetical protein
MFTAVAAIIGALTGFFGGAFANARDHERVVAKQFVLIDQSGQPRGMLAVFPEKGSPDCGTCDGKAHLVIAGQNGAPPQVWPPGGPGLDPQTLQRLFGLIKLLKFL